MERISQCIILSLVPESHQTVTSTMGSAVTSSRRVQDVLVQLDEGIQGIEPSSCECERGRSRSDPNIKGPCVEPRLNLGRRKVVPKVCCIPSNTVYGQSRLPLTTDCLTVCHDIKPKDGAPRGAVEFMVRSGTP